MAPTYPLSIQPLAAESRAAKTTYTADSRRHHSLPMESVSDSRKAGDQSNRKIRPWR